jgi:hypothetical protein
MTSWSVFFLKIVKRLKYSLKKNIERTFYYGFFHLLIMFLFLFLFLVYMKDRLIF